MATYRVNRKKVAAIYELAAGLYIPDVKDPSTLSSNIPTEKYIEMLDRIGNIMNRDKRVERWYVGKPYQNKESYDLAAANPIYYPDKLLSSNFTVEGLLNKYWKMYSIHAESDEVLLREYLELYPNDMSEHDKLCTMYIHYYVRKSYSKIYVVPNYDPKDVLLSTQHLKGLTVRNLQSKLMGEEISLFIGIDGRIRLVLLTQMGDKYYLWVAWYVPEESTFEQYRCSIYSNVINLPLNTFPKKRRLIDARTGENVSDVVKMVYNIDLVKSVESVKHSGANPLTKTPAKARYEDPDKYRFVTFGRLSVEDIDNFRLGTGSHSSPVPHDRSGHYRTQNYKDENGVWQQKTIFIHDTTVLGGKGPESPKVFNMVKLGEAE